MSYVDNGAGLLVPDSYMERAATMLEASGDWRTEFDSPYNRTYGYEQLGVLGAYNLMREWTITERRDVLRRCHEVWERNPFAFAIVDWKKLFVVGDGIQVTYKNPDVEAVLIEFMDDKENNFYRLEKELYISLQTDGEIFLRLFDKDEQGNPTGRTVIAPLRPWDVQYVRTDPNFIGRKLGYIYFANLYDGYQWFGTRYEEIPPEDVVYATINKQSYEIRGRPDLLRILPWLKAYKDSLEEGVRLIRRMSVYYHMKMHNATPAQVSNARAQYKEPPPPASILVTNENVEMNAVQAGIRAGDIIPISRELMLMNLKGAQLPEYMLGNGENANRATTNSQQLPALAKFDDDQDLLKDFWTEVFRRVLMNAQIVGRLPEQVQEFNTAGAPVMDETGQPKFIDALKAFDCKYADIQIDGADAQAQSTAISADMAAGLVSKKTATEKRGYDYAKEQKEIQAEASQDMDTAYNGTGMPQGVGAGAAQPVAIQPAQPLALSMPQNAGNNPPLPTGEPMPANESRAISEVYQARANLMREVIESALQPPQITVNVPAPVVNITNEIPAPVVNITNDIATPDPVININVPEQKPPQVTVNVPPQPAPSVAQMPDGKKVLTLKRDAQGKIIGGEMEVK
jgi:hypothetical protein